MKQMIAILTLLVLPTSLLATERPNVLLISIDDLNDWTGCLKGHPQARTPNLDRLAGQGTLFPTHTASHRSVIPQGRVF